MVIRIQSVCSGLKLLSEPVLDSILDILIAVSAQSLLIQSLILKSLVLSDEPCHAEPLLEQATSHVKEVLVCQVPDVQMEYVVFPGSDPPTTIAMLDRFIPSVSSMREQENEVERHSLGVHVVNESDTSAPFLKDQVMGLGVCED